MRLLALLAALASASLAVEPPAYLRSVSDQRDISGINENDRTLSDGIRQVDERVDDLPTLDGDNAWTGNQTHSGTESFSGTTNHSGPTNFTASVTASSTFTLTNATMIGPQIIQAWALFIGTSPYTILDSIGVTSITYIGAGDYRVNFSTPFANEHFAVTCNADRNASFTATICNPTETGTRDVRSIRLATHRSDSTADDAIRVNFMAVGRR